MEINKTKKIQVCYHSKKDRIELIIKIIKNNCFGFSPEIMDIDYIDRDYDVDKAIALILKSGRNSGAIFKTKDENITLTIGFIALIEGPLSLIWSIKDNVTIDFDFLDFFRKEEDFVSAYIYDYNDVYWQSETLISEYEVDNRKHGHLKKIRDEWDDLVIDVSTNYGRKVNLKNTSLCASPKMWFSDLFFEISGVDKDKILKLNNALDLGNGIVEITLFDDIFTSDKLENRNKQKEFWQYAGFNNVEKKLWPY